MQRCNEHEIELFKTFPLLSYYINPHQSINNLRLKLIDFQDSGGGDFKRRRDTDPRQSYAINPIKALEYQIIKLTNFPVSFNRKWSYAE